MSLLAALFLTVSLLGALVNLAAAALTWRRLAARGAGGTPRLQGNGDSRGAGVPSALPAVTLLKPLHGDRGGLAANLRGLLDQDYDGPIQMLCGVASADDPAVAAVADSRIELVVTGEPGCANRKVGNLVALEARARGEALVLSDADIRVPAGYLTAVVEALREPGIGAVTCLYVGVGGDADTPGGGWARLAAMDIDYRFLPNAVLGTATRMARPCFGSTIALKRETLAAIGGFAAFKEVLADDYEIGRAVRRLGLRLAIPPMVVAHVCGERSLRELIAHELRWARTIRRIDPPGHAASFVTHAFALALIGGALAVAASLPLALAIGVPALVLAARLAAKRLIDAATGANAGPGWLLPARDVLSFAIFLASFAGDTVTWSGRRYRVRPGGVLSELQEPICRP